MMGYACKARQGKTMGRFLASFFLYVFQVSSSCTSKHSLNHSCCILDMISAKRTGSGWTQKPVAAENSLHDVNRRMDGLSDSSFGIRNDKHNRARLSWYFFLGLQTLLLSFGGLGRRIGRLSGCESNRLPMGTLWHNEVGERHGG
jgi:hypothetical protein